MIENMKKCSFSFINNDQANNRKITIISFDENSNLLFYEIVNYTTMDKVHSGLVISRSPKLTMFSSIRKIKNQS